MDEVPKILRVFECHGAEFSDGSMPFLVEIANGPMGSSHPFEAAFQVRLQRGSQAGQLPVPAHLV